MGVRGIQDPIAADLIEQMLAEQARLREEIIDLQQARAIMMERTRPDDITVPQEGQIVVDPDGSHALATTGGIKYFADGEWRQIAAAVLANMPWGDCRVLGQSSVAASTNTAVAFTNWDIAPSQSDITQYNSTHGKGLSLNTKGFYFIQVSVIWNEMTDGVYSLCAIDDLPITSSVNPENDPRTKNNPGGFGARVNYFSRIHAIGHTLPVGGALPWLIGASIYHEESASKAASVFFSAIKLSSYVGGGGGANPGPVF